jgi:acyl-CoA synthetase (AMP-forming)/AMP-acid ligase II
MASDMATTMESELAGQTFGTDHANQGTPGGMKTLQEVMLHWARVQPDAPLLIAPETDRMLTYGELARQTQGLVRALTAQGIAPGAHIGLFLQNGLQTTRLFLSIMAAGYVVTPFNLLAQEDQLAWVLDHSDCQLVFYSAEQARTLHAAMAKAKRQVIAVEIDPNAQTLTFDQIPSGDPALAPIRFAPVQADQPALLMYTSGTTGTPKGVRLSHHNLIHAARSVSAWHQLGPSDRVLSSLPLYHINGQSIATITPFFSGGSIVAPQKFSVSQWWPMVQKYRCTWINMVPTIIAYLLNAANDPDVPDAAALRQVRFGRSASAPLPPEHHQAFEKRFGVTVIEAMGMTESSSLVFCNPHDDRRRYGSPGLPCGVQAKVVSPEGAPLGDNETGEICLRGDNVMAGYYKGPEETRKAFDAQGWLKTGDLGLRDADGFYFVTGRLKELIIKGGENIAPREIDEVLLNHTAVLDAACVGVPDANYGQEIMACVVLRDGVACSEAEIRAFCHDKLGRYKTPKEFHFVSDLPRGPSGKVQRLKLVDWVKADAVSSTEAGAAGGSKSASGVTPS